MKSSPPAPTNALTPTHDFRPTLERLAQLSRNHLLYFRLEVGRLMLEEFFHGDADAYLSHAPDKDHRFSDFLAAHREDIRELGLGESVLRQCIVAQITISTLPPGTVEKLLFTHVVELARVDDDATRRLLAVATMDNKWSSRQLRDAVNAAAAGRWIDAQPELPGLQPAAPEAPEKQLQLGRVVTRFEKAAEDLDNLGVQLSGRTVAGQQKERVREALARLKAK
ncbi:MAG TPA: hypothetical protein PLA94_30935, partial [Myxococcota bacterium]|nr:hypothetical protein [Myxococcota bacterium]